MDIHYRCARRCGPLMLLCAWYLLTAAVGSTAETFDLRDALKGPEPDTFPKQTAERREQFFEQTKFKLTDEAKRLVQASDDVELHLPFWFDFEQYKKVYKEKVYTEKEQENKHHKAYLNTCFWTLRQRVLYRTLATEPHDAVIDEHADWVGK